MSINKKDAFDIDQVSLADFAKAMSHPARIEILSILANRETCICGEIVEVMPLSQSTVSQHLKELKNIGLVTGEIDGLKSCYCINWETFERLSTALKTYMEKITNLKPLNKCC